MIMNKKGLTIAEAVIAMVLLATVTVGIYGVITAAIRSGRKTDMREDMAYAIAQASAKIKSLVSNNFTCVQWADDDTCALWDSCLEYDATGACLSWSDCKTETFTGSGVFGCADKSAVSQNKITTDLCDRPLKDNAYIVDSATQSPVGALSPFESGKDYRIEDCFLPTSCDRANSYFYYNALPADDNLRFNIQFHIKCNGQTI